MPTLRPMTIDDYDAVRRLWESTPGIGLDPSDARAPTERYLARNPGLSLVACDDVGAIVAAVLCGHDGRRGYLSHMAVGVGQRGRGLGRQMTEHCLRRLAELGVQKCNVRIFTHNTQAAAFWKKLGFDPRADLAVLQRATS